MKTILYLVDSIEQLAKWGQGYYLNPAETKTLTEYIRELQTEIKTPDVRIAELETENKRLCGVIEKWSAGNLVLSEKIEKLIEQRRTASFSAMCSETTREKWIADCDAELVAIEIKPIKHNLMK